MYASRRLVDQLGLALLMDPFKGRETSNLRIHQRQDRVPTKCQDSQHVDSIVIKRLHALVVVLIGVNAVHTNSIDSKLFEVR